MRLAPRFVPELAALALLCALPGKADTRQAFLQLIDRPRVPLAPEVRQMPDAAGNLEQFHFTFASEAGERVPGILIRRKDMSSGRHPAVIALHGTGFSKEDEAGLIKELAGKGFIGIAIDGRYHGERAGGAASSSEAYNNAMLRTWRTGEEHPFLYDSAWDIMRLIDYLETRPDVDAARIGAIGISKGGMELYLAAAVDPRIAVAIPCISVQSFRWALDNDSWHSRVGTFQSAINAAAADANVAKVDAAFVRQFYDRVAPGIYSDFDGSAMTPLIAPRPLLTINGGADARTPLPGLMECLDAIRKSYAAANAGDNFRSVIEENTGHRVTADSYKIAVDWFVRWLKPEQLP